MSETIHVPRLREDEPLGLPPVEADDPMVAAYSSSVDHATLRENCRRTVAERARLMAGGIAAMEAIRKMRQSG